MNSGDNPLLKVVNLVKYFPLRASLLGGSIASTIRGKVVHAVDGVSFHIDEMETFGLVGESGSGKTTLGRTILLLTPSTSGEIIFRGLDITKLKGRALREVRRDIQIVFQDPISSLDPRMRVKDIIKEPLRVSGIRYKRRSDEMVREMLELVGLSPEHYNRFPHEFSGGQRQRIGIARALINQPKLVVLDEPTSALDASVQAQILNLLKKLQRDFKLSYLFITHNINVVRYMSNRIAVMYLGRIVEVAEADTLVSNPLHPYTKDLIASIPPGDPASRLREIRIRGETPSPIDIPRGCRFNPRCPYTMDICGKFEPELREVKQGHQVACHLYDGAP
ncbi:MAG: ABC transporter ATP-binding protein [Candidatus Bathyarchaeia archaeon]